jgi:NAD-dependent deacetylase
VELPSAQSGVPERLPTTPRAGRDREPTYARDVEEMSALDRAQAAVGEARRIVVLTGAGISTDSGIPDFRGPNGLWTRNPKAERTSDIRYYVNDPEVRRLAWLNRLDTPVWTAEPNAGHRAIVELQRQRRLHAVVTQNIDGLHQAAGTDPELVVEVHGTVRDTRCLSCDDVRPMTEALDRVRSGEEDPPCRVCGGIIKSDTISFGQALVPDVIDRALRVAAECDLLLAVGSTLSVYPVAGCVPTARRAGATVVIVNASPTEMDPIAHHVLRGQIADVLPTLVTNGV